MKLPRHLLNPDPKKLRQFASGWFVFFLGLGAYQHEWRGREALAFGLGAGALIGVMLCWLAPGIFRWVYVGWMLLAFPVGWLSSQLALTIMFFGVVTPVAVLFRIVRRDRLNRFKPVAATTYWKTKTMPADVRRYLRLY